MAEEKEKLLRLVNSSGFPFQLAVADQIKKHPPEFGWQLVAQEYPWHSVDNDRRGFIDIVIRNEDFDRMVIECKRTRAADWVFLLPKNERSAPGTQSRMLYLNVDANSSSQVKIGWHNFYTQPDSIISEFCVVRGTGEGHRPMLESLCDVLLNSVESLAQEESLFALRGNTGLCCTYVPVIVTNANLQVCRFKPTSISLEGGEIPDGEFEMVPYVRFFKSLSNQLDPNARIANMSAANRERQRTVFVVQSTQLANFLEHWYIPNNRENQRPWE